MKNSITFLEMIKPWDFFYDFDFKIAKKSLKIARKILKLLKNLKLLIFTDFKFKIVKKIPIS